MDMATQTMPRKGIPPASPRVLDLGGPSKIEGQGSEVLLPTFFHPVVRQQSSSQKSVSAFFWNKFEVTAPNIFPKTGNGSETHLSPPPAERTSSQKSQSRLSLSYLVDQSRERISEIEEPASPSSETKHRFIITENESEGSLRKGNVDIAELDEPEDIVRA
ncbi:hypothetical protein EDD17DRAFT_1877509 [Pisolithus thermaeus]|nr:hypothetical protein EDD17DRAFT_1877509 [Pisolithus thermaeus]